MAYWSSQILSDILYTRHISTFGTDGEKLPLGNAHLLLLTHIVSRRGLLRETGTYLGDDGNEYITTGGTRDIHNPFEEEAAQE
jgi:hypothetical protein